MAKGMYFGANSVARKCKKAYIGVGGAARKIKKIYVGVGGVARLAWSSGIGFLAGGGSIYTLRSKNGSDWSTFNIDGTNRLSISSSVYANGIMILVGDQKSFYTKDGVSFTQITAFNSLWMCCVDYVNGVFFAGGNEKLFYSNDGISWTQVGNFSGYRVEGVCYSSTNSRYVAITRRNSDNSARAWFSSDITSWNLHVWSITMGTGHRGIIWDGTRYVVCGHGNSNVYYTTELGTNWSEIASLPNDVYRITVKKLSDGYTYVLGSSGKIIKLSGITVIGEFNLPFSADVYDIILHDGIYYAVTYNPAKICKSSGSTWNIVADFNTITSSTGNYLKFIEYGGE